MHNTNPTCFKIKVKDIQENLEKITGVIRSQKSIQWPKTKQIKRQTYRNTVTKLYRKNKLTLMQKIDDLTQSFQRGIFGKTL